MAAGLPNSNVRFWPEAEMRWCAAQVRFREQSGHDFVREAAFAVAIGVEQTSPIAAHMSVDDPKRTRAGALERGLKKRLIYPRARWERSRVRAYPPNAPSAKNFRSNSSAEIDVRGPNCKTKCNTGTVFRREGSLPHVIEEFAVCCLAYELGTAWFAHFGKPTQTYGAADASSCVLGSVKIIFKQAAPKLRLR